jgi:L-fucose isomerase-like protein
LSTAAKRTPIHPSRFGKRAPAHGAACLTLQHLLAGSSHWQHARDPLYRREKVIIGGWPLFTGGCPQMEKNMTMSTGVIPRPLQAKGETPPLRPVTLGVIVGNRGGFPAELALNGRKVMLEVLARAGLNPVIAGEGETRYGAVESLQEARQCAQALRRHRDEIDGVLITLPNFGDERAVANTVRTAGLDVPVLVHAFPDDPLALGPSERRDSFCGKLSVCNNLTQYGIPFSLTSHHTVDPADAQFADDLRQFAAVCRIVRGLKRMRVGMLGARTTPFTTVRFSEKLLERHGISVETLDLSEALGRIGRLSDHDPDVVIKAQGISAYVDTRQIPETSITKMAKLGVVVDHWMNDSALDATAIQCWTALEEYFGVAPCTVMSMASNSLMPSACETDVAGVVSMYALSLASGEPSALVDWNNNYGKDPEKAIVFHCSNLPKKVLSDIQPRMERMAVHSTTIPHDQTAGPVSGRIRENPFTYLRVATDDQHGTMHAYVGEGAFTADPLNTFGGYGVVRVARLQELLRFICRNGFEHHVAVNQTTVADVVEEALGTYLGWDVYHHK